MIRRPLLLVLFSSVAALSAGDTRMAGSVAPVGLSLFFTDGAMAPVRLVGDAPRYLQEIDITATVVTAADEGIDPVIRQGDLARLDWTGIYQVEEDWRPSGDGTFMRQRFYRGARWMERPSLFELFPANEGGELLDEPIVAHAGVDDRSKESDDGFVRRFVARQIATGCPAVGDCSGATFVAQGLVQLRQARHPDERARTLPAATSQLILKWTEDPQADRRVGVSSIPGEEAPYSYGFTVRIEAVNPPAGRSYYLPGEQVSFRVTFLDGAGNRLHPLGSLPTYGQFFRGEVASGLRYFDNFRLSPTTYYALKHRESNIIVALSGPTSALRVPSQTVMLEGLFAPQIPVAFVDVDGYSGVAAGVPAFGVTFGGLFDPTLWETPVSDVVTLTIPTDALPGSYVAAVKARRDYGGEALNRAATTTIQVGSATPTQYTLKTIACTTCHSGPAALGSVLHGLNDRRACYGCHASLVVEPDAALDIRVHMVHDRSRRFPGAARDCLTCHLAMPDKPARGFLQP